MIKMIDLARVIALFVALAFPFPFPFAAVAQDKPFTHIGLAKDGQRYEAWIKANWKTGPQKPQEALSIAQKTLGAGNDMRGAARAFAQILAGDDKNADAWFGLARALLAMQPDPNQGAERYDLPVNASGAAYFAYERARTPVLKARALYLLSEALKRRSHWRPAIEALKASLAISDSVEVRAAYDALKSEHGFRMLDYSVEQEAMQPRLCVQFSEALDHAQADFSKFVSVDGKDPQAVVADGKQLCIEGLAHGKRYEILVRSGLPSDVGETLTKPAELGVYVRDRSPFVRFSGRSYVLPSRGQAGIPVVTVNTDKIGVEIYRIGDRALASSLGEGELQRQLSSYELETLKGKTGARIYAGEMAVATRLNEEITTAVPVGEAVPELKPGVYAMIARPSVKSADDGDTLATQWFIVSDLGLTAMTGDNGIHAFVRSLASAAPVSGVSVRLVARNNEILGQAKTDASGYARFEAGLKRGEGGMAPAILVAEGPAGDYAFLDLTEAAFDLTDRGVKGRAAPGALDAYLYAERGVYRPGETVYVSALVRDRAGKAAGLPTTLIVVRPDGVEHRRIVLNDQGIGGRAAELALPGSAMTGTWRARLHADPKADPLASVAFLVEDFVPERLELKLEAAAKALAPEENGTIKVSGRYLYGPPAANLALEGDIVVKPSTKDVEGLAGYRFGLDEEKISPVRKALEGLPSTNAEGRTDIAVMLPAIPRTARPLEAEIMVRMREPGGRTIERTLTLPVDPVTTRVGIKPLFANGEIAEGETAGFEVIVLDGAGRRAAAKGLKWEIVRLDQRWQWYRRDNQWAWEAVTLTRKVANGAVDAIADAPARVAAKLDWGRYRLQVSSPDVDGPASSVAFSSGWYAAQGADSPEMLEVALDKASYRAGETAKLRIASRDGGKALITVLGNGLLAAKQVDLPKGGGEVPVEVDASWGAGAYVTAAVYRPMDEQAKRMPGRALGVKWLGLDQSERTLNVGLELPAKVKSGANLAVPVKLGGLKAGEEARVTVAAVDVGILNLTRYQAPAPESWFNAQRQLGTEIRDFYGRLIDGMRAERGRLRSGGDSGGGLSMTGSPPVEATVALFSGIVKPGADGTALVDFQLPQFNGTIRVMAVAWSADKIGHATGDVIVRDAVALIASGPRFMTLGDEARLELDVHNIEGPAGAYSVAVEQTSAAGAKATVTGRELRLAANERKFERFRVKPQEVGLFTYDVRIAGPNGIDVKRHLTFDVKPPAGDVRRTTVSQLSAKGGKLTLSGDLLQDLIPSRTRISVSVGPAARMDVPGLLAQLDRYPYGCAEQTTSRALPLLYANELSVQAGLPRDAELKTRIQKAIDRVFEMQDASGAFGVWGPRNGDIWLTSYVTEFLTRAKEAGFDVKPQRFAESLDRLQNFVSYAQDFKQGGEERAYALYVLARNGRAPIGELRYYVDTYLDRFSTPLAKAQLGAALAMLGDKERAEKAFKSAIAMTVPADLAVSRRDYGSDLRDRAALVTLAAENRVTSVETPKLASVVAAAFATRAYTSTQEQAWMLLAAKALTDQAKDTRLSVNGAAQSGSLNRTLTAAEVKDGTLTITNEGDVATDAVISVIGASLTPEPAIEKGFKVERSYFTLDGKPVDLKSAAGGTGQLKQTDRLVVVLKIEAQETGGRILLVDRLPAGLEVENPRLVESGDVKSLEWLKTTMKPEHTEFRDDRFVAAFNFYGRARGGDGDDNGENKGPVSAATVAYMVRAVTPGSFVHPAATVEDMYRPDRFARTAAGRLEVTAKE